MTDDRTTHTTPGAGDPAFDAEGEVDDAANAQWLPLVLQPGRTVPASRLQDYVDEMSVDMTFRDFCAIIAGLPESPCMLGVDLAPYLVELDAPRCREDEPEFVLERVEFEWALQVFEGRRASTELVLSFFGVGPLGRESLDGGQYVNHRYGLDFIPWSALAHLPITLSETMVIGRFGEGSVTRERIPSPGYRLCDLIESLVRELSFHGSPGDRDAMLGELRRRMDEARLHPERLVSADELFAELRAKHGPAEGRDPYPGAAFAVPVLPAGQERVGDVLGVLDACWRRHPELRLGQLLVNVVDLERPVPELFYLPDAELARRASEWQPR